MDDRLITPELLKRYLERTCDPDEEELVEQWYLSIEKTGASPPEFNEVIHLIRVRKAIWESEEKNRERIMLPRGRQPFGWRRYAVAAVLFIAFGLTFYFYQGQTVRQEVLSGVASPVSVENTGRQIRRVELPDGSVVWLNPGSELAYSPEAFLHSRREVAVQGEAFFDVERDEASPFIVTAEALRVQVLGTSFHVKAGRGQASYEVTVVTGKVRVYREGREKEEEMELLPAQKAVFEVSSGILTSEGTASGEGVMAAWQSASLDFEDAPLAEVAQRLERKFGVSVHLENDRLRNCLLKATFENLMMAEILEAISQMLELTYEIEKDRIVFKGQGCDQ